jgi:hypothetical protein
MGMNLSIDEYAEIRVVIPLMPGHAKEIIARAKTECSIFDYCDDWGDFMMQQEPVWTAFTVHSDRLQFHTYCAPDPLDGTMTPTAMTLDDEIRVANAIRRIL